MTEFRKGPQREDFLRSIYVQHAAKEVSREAQDALDQLLASCDSAVDCNVVRAFHTWKSLDRMYLLLTRGTDEGNGPISRAYRVVQGGLGEAGEEDGGEREH